MPASRASAASVGGCSALSIVRQRAATIRAWDSASDGWSGRQRLQGRKPARSASAGPAWKATFSGRGLRAAHEGLQYTPVLATE